MATTIQVKRSASVTATEMASKTLAYGELAYSAAAKQMWIGASDGTPTLIAGNYFSEVFPTTLTSGTNVNGKVMISDSTDGSFDFNDKNITNVNNLNSDALGFGTDTTSGTGTITAGSNTITLASTHTDGNLTLAAAGTGTLTLNGKIAGTAISDTTTLGSSDDVVPTQKAVKTYVDNETGAVTTISQLNSSVVVSDSGTGSIVSTVDGNATLTLVQAAATLQATDFALKLKSPETGAGTFGQDARNTSVEFLDNSNNALATIKGAHDGTLDNARGGLILSTHNGSSSAEAVRIDSNQNVTITGDLTVNGTREIINTTVTTLQDPVLTLGGDFGAVTDVTFSQPSTAWGTNQSDVVVEQHESNAGGQGASFRVTTNGAGAITSVDVVSGGHSYVATNTITVQDPASTGTAMTITVSTVSAGPASDDNKDRGIEYRWHNGSAAKLGFFGLDDSTGKFTFIPDATKSTAEVFSGNAGTIVAATFEGDLTGDVTGNITGQVSTATQNSITSIPNLATTGTLTAGAIDASTSNNFPITMGQSDLTSSGQIVIDVDGTAKSTDGAITLGAGADGAFWVDSSNDLHIYNQGETTALDAARWNFLNSKDYSSVAHNTIMSVGKTTAHALQITAAINTSDHLTTVTFDTPAGGGSDADRGQYNWKVDGKSMFVIKDDGIVGHTATGSDATYTSPDAVAGQTIPYIDNFIISGGTFT